MATTIYILKLMDDCFYVGKTNDIEKRYFEHTSGKGSIWTKIHRPIKIIKTIENCSPFEEDKKVKEYMAMYGIDKVRGGTYVKEILDDEQIKTLQKEINATMDLCNNCGKSGHFVKDCKSNIKKQSVSTTKYLNLTQNNKLTMFDCQYCDKTFETKQGAIYHEKFYCKNKEVEIEVFVCQYCDKEFETEKGANYHIKFYCKNTVEIFACQYCDKEFETQKGATFHENMHCTKKNTKSKGKANKCFTCGREGHYADDCYATKHVKGYDI
jgi:hypothetical protein